MRLALGTVQFGLPYGVANQGGKISRPTARAMLRLAASNGIDLLDTAVAYGESETCLGAVGTKGFSLVTKLSALPTPCPDRGDWIWREVEASLERLGMDALYGLLLHRPHQLLEPFGEEIFRTLQDLKEVGKTRKIGISIYDPEELEKLIPVYRFDLVQAPFNLVDRRLDRTGWLRRLQQKGIEIHTRSAFLQGLLLMPQESIPQKFSPWLGLWNRWHEWLSLHNISPLQACLAFPLSFPEIDRVVVGADDVHQLEQIIEAAQGGIPDDFPDLQCDDPHLINPSYWGQL